MKRRTETLLGEARLLLAASQDAAKTSFAAGLAARSMESHIAELEIAANVGRLQSTYELLEMRLSASAFRHGSIPLSVLSDVASDIRRMFGFAALRFGEGRSAARRVPDVIYQQLDLRLAGLLPGSSRLVVAAAANRDLFDDGPASRTLQRVFEIVRSAGSGDQFLQSVTELGPSASKNLRDLLRVVRAQSADLYLEWTHRGQTIATWSGEKAQVDQLAASLERTELRDERVEELVGTVEMLSKRERLHIRDASGLLIRVLFPSKLLPAVSELHIEQRVTLKCNRIELANPLTGESSVTYELLGRS